MPDSRKKDTINYKPNDERENKIYDWIQRLSEENFTRRQDVIKKILFEAYNEENKDIK